MHRTCSFYAAVSGSVAQVEQILDQITEESGLSKSALAIRSGLARSTQHRIRSGTVDPTLGSIRELALAAGYELDLSLAPLSDPDAARAARAILDPPYEATYALNGRTRGVEEWVKRLHRWVPDRNPVEIVREAGQSSSLLHRPGAEFLRGHVTGLKVASAGDFSKQDWLLSGAAVIDRIDAPVGDDDGEASNVATGTAAPGRPYVVYCSDPHRFVRLLDNMEQVRPEKANLIVAELTDDVSMGSWEDGSIKLVAPIQGLIDAFGIGGPVGQSAERIARSW